MRKTATVIAFLFAAALAGFGAWYYKSAQKTYSGPSESIVLGGVVSDANIVFFTGEDRHFLAGNGINFTFKTYGTGLASIAALLNNEIDIAGAAEYPVVARAFNKDKISIIASIDKSYVIYFVGLTDRGIRHTADIKGKKVGLPRGSIAEFYFGRFLSLNGMSISDVSLVNLPWEHAGDAVAHGRVDAVVTEEPYISQILKQYPHRTVSWSVHSSQAVYVVLMCRNDWIKQHPDLVKRVLNSFEQAEAYIAEHPTEAKAILQKRYRYDDGYIARVWPEHQFALSLDQSLVVALEDEARWMIDNKMTTEKQVPDFLNYIYEDGLKAVKPEAVKIIR